MPEKTAAPIPIYQKIESALQHLDPNDRDFWVLMAFAIKSELGDNGFDLWAKWGKDRHPRPEPEVIATWKSAKAGGKIGIGTLFYHAKNAGWVPPTPEKEKKPSPEELKRRKEAAAALVAKAKAEEDAKHAQAAQLAQKLWNAATPTQSHPYLERKGIKSHGLRLGAREYVTPGTGEIRRMPCLFIPILDYASKLWSLQIIITTRRVERKLYLKGGAKHGHFFCIGNGPLEHQGRKVFVLGEGYATCASIHECTGHQVLVCFDASNLLAVAQQVRQRNPNAIILLGADNDLWNHKPDGTPCNPGIEAATKVAGNVGGIVAIPPFTLADAHGMGEDGFPIGPKDFNDLHQIANGAELVSTIFAEALLRLALSNQDARYGK